MSENRFYRESVTKSGHQLRVEEFMKKAGQSVSEIPSLRSADIRRFRAKMILEEALETIQALGFNVIMKPFDLELEISAHQTHEPNLIEIADGCADIKVVTTGTLSALGISDIPLQEEVDKNNLAKFGPGAYRRESDGKWIKPPGHKPPDIEGVLLAQGWEKRSE
jgi:predicted HAD superfamily Cof-like phosphohydrolase